MGERKFLFNYRFEGADYGLDVAASDPDEARRKISAIGLARYEGEIFATIRVPARALMILRILNWLPRP